MTFSQPEGPYQRRDEQGDKSPEVGKDLAEVVAAGVEDGEDGIAEHALVRPGRPSQRHQ